MKRRTWLKTVVAAAAAAALPGCKPQAHTLVPYLLPDDEIVPGTANWYASTCRECAAGCGILVRTMEGRAKKIEGNPDHPLNQGKLCAKGQASLQSLYNPDRLTQPLERKGIRGDATFVPMSWEEGLRRCAERLQDRRTAPIMITRPVSGTMARLLRDFINALGGELYQYEPGAELPLRTAWRDSTGSDTAPQYDLAHTDYLLSFGAPFLEQWLSPVAMGIGFGRMRQGRPTQRGRFVHIEPRMSLTGANADQWIPIKPGAEGLLALAIGQILLDEGRFTLPRQELKRYRSFFSAGSLEETARATGIEADLIIHLAREFASARAPLAIGGGPACAHTNGTISLIAINGLNALTGNLGREAADGFFTSREAIPWLTERTIMTLLERRTSADPASVLLYDVNPLFSMPPAVPVKALFERAPFIVSFSAFLDESTQMADLVLPDRSPLESWGDHLVESPTHTIGLSQPVVTPLHDCRQIGDSLLELGRRLGINGFHASTFYDVLRTRWRTFLDASPHENTPDWFENAWTANVQRGGWWQGPSQQLKPLSFKTSRRYEPAIFSGNEAEFPFVLYPYPSMTIGYGDGANRPWLQELPDTMTSVVWGSWVEINPSTARALNIHQGELVRIISMIGSLEAPAVLYPGIRPDVVAMPLGQGHWSYGRYALRRGVNPLRLLAPALDSVTGTSAAGATRVRIETTGTRGRLVTLEHPVMEPHDLITISRTSSRSIHG
ncbi:MAG TPA: molybdopterin-dependent oxidoreductase [Nitrospira sp.]